MDWQRGEIPFLHYPPNYDLNRGEEEHVDEKDLEKLIIQQNNEKLQQINIDVEVE